QDDGAAQPGAHRVGRRGGGGVAGGGADDHLGVGGGDLRHRHRHPAVLEGAGGVGALDLDVDLRADPLGEHGGRHERGAALAQGDHRVTGLDRQPVGVLRDHASPLVRHQSSSTLVTASTRLTDGIRATASAVAASAASLARCVTTTSTAAPSVAPVCSWVTVWIETSCSPKVPAICASTPGTSATSSRSWNCVVTSSPPSSGSWA